MKMKKYLALMLVALMTVSCLPFSVFAEEISEDMAAKSEQEATTEVTDESQAEATESSSANNEETSAPGAESEESNLTSVDADTYIKGDYIYNVPYVDVDENGNKTTKIWEEAQNLDSFPYHYDLNGSYVLTKDVSDSRIDRFFVPEGWDVTIILMDGCTLTLGRGFCVCGGGSLTIYGQENQTGKIKTSGTGRVVGYSCGIEVEPDASLTINGGIIEATGDEEYSGGGGAGIGGTNSQECGNITINYGTVTARGGDGAAGIGAGNDSRNGGNITINGGTVYAYGGGAGGAFKYGGGAGIGGGEDSTGENITINGGTVYAYGNAGSAGIGGGEAGIGSNIKITGGTVYAEGKLGGAGIGGGNERKGDNITITGGTVEARGSLGAAGIGGGNDADGSNITIDGGKVKAVGSAIDDLLEDYGGGAGIGGGEDHAGYKITINGGDVEAYGQSGGAGIGGGEAGPGLVSIKITGGTIYAEGRLGGAGIGGGRGSYGKNIEISDGNVTAKAVDSYGAGIGGGYESFGEEITISGGSVKATGATGGAGIGGGEKSYGQNINITGGTVKATGTTGGAGIGGGDKSYGRNINITGGTVTATAGANGAGIGGGNGGNCSEINISGKDVEADSTTGDGNAIGAGKGGSASGIYVNCYLVIQTQKRETDYYSDIDLPKDTDITDRLAGRKYLRIIKLPEISYMDYVDGQYVEKTIKDFRTITSDTTELKDDIYVLTQNVEMKHSLKITGDVKLILYFKNTLKISGVSDNSAGINVSNTDSANPVNKLTICDTGVSGAGIEVTGGTNAAGIGGNQGESASAITINAGNITAKGGENGAGIGGGERGSGSYITINGGTVTAQGGANAAGIGGGKQAVGEYITFNDGVINAQGGISGAGIGGGFGRHGSDITVNGGVITAKGGEQGAGIGGGQSDGGFNIRIHHGSVTAVGGGEYTSGIGGGEKTGSSDIYVDTTCTVKVGSTNPPSTTIENTGGDIWQSLHYKQYVTVRESVTASYVDADGRTKSVEAAVIFETMRKLEDGWYVVNKDMLIDHQLDVSGDAHIILMDGCKLTVKEETGYLAAIRVSNENPAKPENTLTIYGQEEGSGTLNAEGRSFCAAIGGNSDENGSGITINGGIIKAYGGVGAAAIGGGNEGVGSNITVNGGIVIAEGRAYGAGIGGGNKGSGSSITLNGGTVTATGGMNGAGIGGGRGGEASDITINGGTVTATAGESASAIGGGKDGSSNNIVLAQFISVKTGDNAAETIAVRNDGKDISSKLAGRGYVQTQSLVTVKDDEVLVYGQETQNSIVKASTQAAIFYKGKTQATDTFKSAYLADTYDSILTKSDDYVNKSDAATPLSTLSEDIKSFRFYVDGTAKDLLGTKSASDLKTALKTITSNIGSLKDGYYGNLSNDLQAAISLNNGEFCNDESTAVSIDTLLRGLYTSDAAGKSVITGKSTATNGDKFYTALTELGNNYLNDDTLGVDVFSLYEGGKAYAVNFNSETTGDRAVFNEAAYNTYESGYLLLNTAMVYDMKNHQNQLDAINALQAASKSDNFTADEKSAIKKEIAALEKTLGMSLDAAATKHEECIAQDQNRIDTLNEQYSNIREAWQESDEQLQIDNDTISNNMIYCYRTEAYYDRIIKSAGVNDGIENANSTQAGDFVMSNSGGYTNQLQITHMIGDRERTNTSFTDAASVSDIVSMNDGAKNRKTTLNEEIAEVFVIEGSETDGTAENEGLLTISTDDKDDNCLGIYVNGEQNAYLSYDNLSFIREVSYIENGSLEGKNTITRKWRATDGALREAQTDLDSTLLVIYNTELGGGDDEEAVATGNVNTGFDADNLWMLALIMFIFIASGTGCVILIDRRRR